MNNDVFEYRSYRLFLKDFLKNQPKQGHGLRSQWAQAVGCQVAFISHVLNGTYDLSAEQCEALARHLGFNREETEFFLLLNLSERSGTVSLKKLYQQQIQDRLQVRNQVRHRMKIQEDLSLEDQAIYYSGWLYSAVHILLTIPDFQESPEKIAEYFHKPLAEIRKIMDFLESRGFIKKTKGKWQVTNQFIIVNKDSPLYIQQQSFWRNKAIDSISNKDMDEIHFASVFSLSEEDVRKVREILLKSIESSTDVIKPSKEEKLYAICMDFFSVR